MDGEHGAAFFGINDDYRVTGVGDGRCVELVLHVSCVFVAIDLDRERVLIRVVAPVASRVVDLHSFVGELGVEQVHRLIAKVFGGQVLARIVRVELVREVAHVV